MTWSSDVIAVTNPTVFSVQYSVFSIQYSVFSVSCSVIDLLGEPVIELLLRGQGIARFDQVQILRPSQLAAPFPLRSVEVGVGGEGKGHKTIPLLQSKAE